MRAKITEKFKDPETGEVHDVGAVVDGRTARFAVNSGKAERYSARERLHDAHRLILSGGLLTGKGK